MKRSMKKIRGALFAMVLFMGTAAFLWGIPLRANPVYADTGDYVYEAEEEYTIEHYQVDMVVGEDGTMAITETLDCYFDPDAGKHGIIRSIPLHNDITREDGTISSNRAKVSNVHVNATTPVGYDEYTENGNYCIRIGDAYSYVEGDFSYQISYDYSIGRDPLDDADELYMNLIGPQWDTSIKSVDFTVTMPKVFDADSLGFTHGGYGSLDTDNVYYKIEDNKIIGYYHEVLPPYNGLTLRLTLPEGYFVYPLTIWERFGNFFAALPFAGLLAMIWYYLTKGRNVRPAEPVEFYPPEGRNPLEIGYLYDGSLDDKDITSLLVHLANAGYWDIEEEKGKWILHLKKFAYEGNNRQEKLFFDGIVRRSKEEGIVREEDLTNKFYKTVASIRKTYESRKIKDSIFEPVTGAKIGGFLGGMLLVLLAAYTAIFRSTFESDAAMFGALVIMLFVCFYVPFFVAGINSVRKGRLLGVFIIGFVIVHFIAMGGGGVALLFRNGFFGGDINAMLGVLGILAGGTIMVLATCISKRTPYGNEILGKIRGFRNFLELAEKPKLEQLVEEDPAYFYKILPYTHVLGVSSKWIKKFDGIAVPPPEWYGGGAVMTTGDWSRMNTEILHSMDRMSGVLQSRPHETGNGSGWSGGSDSGGGFSSSDSGGGGFSGGGSGGGGGSSW